MRLYFISVDSSMNTSNQIKYSCFTTEESFDIMVGCVEHLKAYMNTKLAVRMLEFLISPNLDALSIDKCVDLRDFHT